jgi:hypothetical protein
MGGIVLKKKLFKIIKILCFILVIFFLVKIISDNIKDLGSIDFKINLPISIISMVIFLIYKFYNAFLWHFLTVKSDCKINTGNSIIAWSYSQLGKFVPGKVFYLLGRLYYYKKENVSTAKITFCFFLENAYTFLSALFMFIVSIPFVDLSIANEYKFYSIILLILFFVFLNPFFAEKGLNFVLKVLKKEPMKLYLAYRDMIIMLLLFVSNWLVMGVGFFILSEALYPVGPSKFFYLTAAFALSNVIGILSFFAPAGIGVRETILIFVLKAIMPSSFAVIISIVSRIWSTAGELMTVLIAFIYDKSRHIKFLRFISNP